MNEKLYVAILVTNNDEDGFKVDAMAASFDKAKLETYVDKQSKHLAKSQSLDLFEIEDVL